MTKVQSIAYGTEVSYVKQKGDVKHFVSISRSIQCRDQFNVTRGTIVDGKNNATTIFNQDERYVGFSILLAVNDGYKLAG